MVLLIFITSWPVAMARWSNFCLTWRPCVCQCRHWYIPFTLGSCRPCSMGLSSQYTWLSLTNFSTGCRPLVCAGCWLAVDYLALFCFMSLAFKIGGQHWHGCVPLHSRGGSKLIQGIGRSMQSLSLQKMSPLLGQLQLLHRNTRAVWDLCLLNSNQNSSRQKQRKARLHQHYQLVIQPAVRALELNGWSATPRVQNHWSAYNEDHWTIAQLLCHGISISAAQWWAQLKLQGSFTVHGASAPGPRSICSFCDLEELENIDHLFLRCSFVESSLGALLCNVDTLTRGAAGSNLECLKDVLAWVYAVETLQKSRRWCGRVKKICCTCSLGAIVNASEVSCLFLFARVFLNICLCFPFIILTRSELRRWQAMFCMAHGVWQNLGLCNFCFCVG